MQAHQNPFNIPPIPSLWHSPRRVHKLKTSNYTYSPEQEYLILADKRKSKYEVNTFVSTRKYFSEYAYLLKRVRRTHFYPYAYLETSPRFPDLHSTAENKNPLMRTARKGLFTH